MGVLGLKWKLFSLIIQTAKNKKDNLIILTGGIILQKYLKNQVKIPER